MKNISFFIILIFVFYFLQICCADKIEISNLPISSVSISKIANNKNSVLNSNQQKLSISTISKKPSNLVSIQNNKLKTENFYSGKILTTPTVSYMAKPFTVFATREGLVGKKTSTGHIIKENDRFVALPSYKAKNKCVKVINPKNGKSVIERVKDTGPWNTKDNYWDFDRETFTTLPRGLPEAQAAFYWNYNNGSDTFGRKVKNPAGIDLADGTWKALGMKNNDFVEFYFVNCP
ncbi:MAG: hypothetical protein QXY62_00410 [Candidatus Altiarchaeota archaeon]